MSDEGEEMSTAANIAAELSDHIDQLVVWLLPNGRRLGGEWVVGSIQGEPGRSMGVHLRGPKTGVWCDFATGEKGALDLVAAALNSDKREAIRWSMDWLGVQHHDQRGVRPGAGASDDLSRLRLARDLWDRSRPIAGTLGAQYLRKTRCIDLPDLPTSLRFHPRLKHSPSGGIYPAIVCAVQSPEADICGIWRIFLDPRTANKAPVDCPRMGLGRIAGGVVRLTPVGDELVIGEGVETCLAVLCADPARTCWAGLSASLMRRIVLPAQVRSVLLLEENDQPDCHGRRASADAVRAVSDRMLAEGRAVRIVRPPPGYKDFNDLLMAGTRHAAR
jgi:hypothetical protein